MIKKFLPLAVLMVTGMCSLAAAQGQQPDRPNILLLLSDDHSYPFLSCYGDPNVRTPTLDRLAAEGMAFHCFFTSAPQCVLSRVSLMTGRSPVAARMTRFSAPLPADEITFPELLREQAGYYTGVCGRSYHLDGSTRSGPAMVRLFEDHGLKTFQNRMDYVRTGSDVQAAQQVREFLQQRPADKPFFLWVNFSDPHHVWNAPDEFRPDPATLKLPAHWPDLPGMRSQLADYCAEVNRVDKTIAGVLQELESRGLLADTLVLFAGDNGAALPHGKGSLYDPGSRVPFLVRWPGKVPAGAQSQAIVSGEDLGPTLLEIAGLQVPSKMSGVSMLPVLQGTAKSTRQYIFIARGPHGTAPVRVDTKSSSYDLGRAVRSDRYKLIYNCTPWIPYGPVDSAGGAAWREMTQAWQEGTLANPLISTYFTPRPVYELYDLQEDPSELENLSGRPELGAVESELRDALAGRMVLDWDYLPLPQLLDKQGKPISTARPKRTGNKNNTKG